MLNISFFSKNDWTSNIRASDKDIEVIWIGESGYISNPSAAGWIAIISYHGPGSRRRTGIDICGFRKSRAEVEKKESQGDHVYSRKTSAE